MTSECVTVSAKPGKILRKALEDEVKKRELEELKIEINRLKSVLDKVNTDITKA